MMVGARPHEGENLVVIGDRHRRHPDHLVDGLAGGGGALEVETLPQMGEGQVDDRKDGFGADVHYGFSSRFTRLEGTNPSSGRTGDSDRAGG